MKLSLIKRRQRYILLLILSTHSFFQIFPQEDLPRDTQFNSKKEESDFHKYSFLGLDQKDTEDKFLFRLKFIRYKKQRTLNHTLETDLSQPVRLISRQEIKNRERISPMIEIALGAGALGGGGTAGAAAAAGTGAAAGAGTGIGAGIGAIASGPALPIIGTCIVVGLIINAIVNNDTEDKASGGGTDPDKDQKEALERQRFEQIRQVQIIEAEKIRVATEVQERHRLEQIRQAEVIEEQRVQKIKDEQECQRLEQVRHVPIIEETLIYQPIDLDEKLHTCIQTVRTDHSESSPCILINELNHHAGKNEAIAHAVFVPGVGVCISIGGSAAAGGIGGFLAGPAIPVIVVGGVGIKWVISVIKGKIEAKGKKDSSGGGGGGDNPDPDKDKDSKKDKDKNKHKGKVESKYPNGIAEDNPKHHQNSQGKISKPPRDVQKMLDTSRAVPGEKYRVNIEDKKFVILREHSPGRWHGYVIDNYTDLIQSERNAFYNTGLTRNVKSGKLAK